MSDDALLALIRTRPFGALVTLKKDGRPQLSNVLHTFDESTRTLRISVTDDRAKTNNLRRDGRASYYVTAEDGWSYAVAEGVADFSPVARSEDDPTVEELVQLYRDLRGEHPDWDEYRRDQVSQKRLVLRIAVDRLYGMAN